MQTIACGASTCVTATSNKLSFYRIIAFVPHTTSLLVLPDCRRVAATTTFSFRVFAMSA